MDRRNHKIGKANANKTAGSSHCAGVREEILHQSRDKTDKSVLSLDDSILSCLQNGRMPTAYPRGCWRGSESVARYTSTEYLKRNEILKIVADFMSSDVAKLGECEFSLISEMNSGRQISTAPKIRSKKRTTSIPRHGARLSSVAGRHQAAALAPRAIV